MRVLRGADLVPSRGKAARTVLESDSSLQEAGNAWLLTILCRSDGGNDFSKPLIGRTEATTYFSGRKIMVTRVYNSKKEEKWFQNRNHRVHLNATSVSSGKRGDGESIWSLCALQAMPPLHSPIWLRARRLVDS